MSALMHAALVVFATTHAPTPTHAPMAGSPHAQGTCRAELRPAMEPPLRTALEVPLGMPERLPEMRVPDLRDVDPPPDGDAALFPDLPEEPATEASHAPSPAWLDLPLAAARARTRAKSRAAPQAAPVRITPRTARPVAPADWSAPAGSLARTRLPALLPLRVTYKPDARRYYPAEALRVGLGGTAIVRITIDARGVVTRAVIERGSGYPALDHAALALARAYRFNRDRAIRRARLPITFQPSAGGSA